MISVPDWASSPVIDVYRRIVPRRVRSLVNIARNRKRVKEILRYYAGTEYDDEVREALSFLPFTEVLQYPYPWARDVSFREPEVDGSDGLTYVTLNGKRCYFPRDMSLHDVSFNATFINDVEQNDASPHLYLTSEFNVTCDDIVVDCGAADGNFGLSIIDRVKKLYIFEPEERWQEPLRRTFGPWADRVEIVQRSVSDSGAGGAVTLDGFFAGKELPTFLKIDVEGYERNVLAGASVILRSSAKKVAVCTYHRFDDHRILSDTMASEGFSVDTSRGYMGSFFDGRGPYLRRALIRCMK
jgi:hypothetical protein